MSTTMNPDWERVVATPEEVAAYRKRAGHAPAVYRYVHRPCGTRLWGSGLGTGSHLRACRKRLASSS